ncbi:MAG: polyprenol phosphomannose-dependent alpha 1,6 mannosyltransferase MptB [Candidatus Omnitrophota bacterium]
MENYKKRLIFTHLLFILSLAVIYSIPYVARMAGDTFLPPQGRFVRFYNIGVITAIFLSYGSMLYYLKKSGMNVFERSRLTVYFWGLTVTVSLLLCFSHAVHSSDLYEYCIRGRMAGLYGINPYFSMPSDIQSDMFYPLIFWKNTPECYGPAWVYIGIFNTLLFPNSLILTIFFHKFVLFVFLLAGGYFFFKICEELNFKNKHILTVAYILNPLMLLMTIVDGHNEIAMVTFILAALWCVLRSRYAVSMILFAVAVNIKFTYVMIAPLFVAYILWGPGPKPLNERLKESAIGIFLAALVTSILWASFTWGSVPAIIDYYRDVNTWFWADTIPYIFYFILEKTGMDSPRKIIEMGSLGIFAISYFFAAIYFFRNVKRDKRAIFTAGSFIFLALYVTNYTPFQPWYLLWVIPLLLLSGIRPKFLLVTMMSYFLMMTFWKRMSALAVPMMVLYFIVYFSLKNKKTELKNFVFSLE